MADLNALGLPSELIDKLSPYLGKQGYEAQAYLNANPLIITPNQAYLIDSSEWSNFLHSLATEYATATSGQEFYSLPNDTQTAIADVQFQYGTSGAKDPNFWSDVTNWNWQAAYNELMNFGDDHTPRRHADAALLKNDLDAGDLPHH